MRSSRGQGAQPSVRTAHPKFAAPLKRHPCPLRAHILKAAHKNWQKLAPQICSCFLPFSLQTAPRLYFRLCTFWPRHRTASLHKDHHPQSVVRSTKIRCAANIVLFADESRLSCDTFAEMRKSGAISAANRKFCSYTCVYDRSGLWLSCEKQRVGTSVFQP